MNKAYKLLQSSSAKFLNEFKAASPGQTSRTSYQMRSGFEVNRPRPLASNTQAAKRIQMMQRSASKPGTVSCST